MRVMTNFLPHIEIESGPNPTAAVIWLHGLGADGNDFATVVPQLHRFGAVESHHANCIFTASQYMGFGHDFSLFCLIVKIICG